MESDLVCPEAPKVMGSTRFSCDEAGCEPESGDVRLHVGTDEVQRLMDRNAQGARLTGYIYLLIVS